MDWSKSKTIFIIIFLVLDTFLLYQFLAKKNYDQYEIFTESSLEERLKEDEIVYVEQPKEKIKERYLSAKSKSFTKEDIEKLQGQQVTISDKNKLISIFKTGTKVAEDFKSNELDSFLKKNIIQGNVYQFWSFDEESNIIIYYQTLDNKMFYNNPNGKLTLFLNDNREIISYEQTLLEKVQEFNNEEEILPSIKAIETLYNKNYLPPKSEVTKPELGYYTLVAMSTSSQVLTPTWRVVINDEENLFVNAFDGEVIELNTEEKILE